MAALRSSQVAIVDGLVPGCSNQFTAHTVRELLGALEEPLSNLIKSGDKVFLKPYLKNGVNDSPESLQVSQPAVIQAVLEILKDYGATVEFGDEGSPNPLLSRPHPSRIWLHEIARRTNTKLVNFALGGGKLKQGKLLSPRRYLISQALLDADAIISLSHFQFHPKFVINGCVKNMFNAVLGKQQTRLETLFRSPKQIAKHAIEVCTIVKPMLSIMDMTIYGTVPRRDVPFNRGYFLAGRDPVSVDTVAAAILGIDPESIWTCRLGQSRGLGTCDIRHINIGGAYRSLPQPRGPDVPKFSVLRRGALERLTSLFNETVLRPHPVIDQMTCDRCGDCAQICPTGAISYSSNGPFINIGQCAECMYCADVCHRRSVQRGFNAPSRFLRRIARRPTSVKTD